MQTKLNKESRARAPSSGLLALLAASLLGLTLASGQSVVSTQPRMGVLMWGDNSHGQCQPPAVPVDVKNVQLACGTSHTLALQSNGLLLAWGDNSYGQLETPAIHKGHSYIRIAASDHNLALRNDGFLQAWGRNDFGQCRVPILPAGLTWEMIAAGGLHSAALRSDGNVVCWGDNSLGQCNVPTLLRGTVYVAVSAGAQHSVALRSDGVVVCWGDRAYGQPRLPPWNVSDPVVALSAGGGHTLALTAGGALIAWGSNESGQCDVPERPYGHSFVAIAAGARHNLALLDDGSVFTWGADKLGQCKPPNVLAGLEAVRISAGGQHSGVLFQAPASDIQPICLGNGSAAPCPCANNAPAGQIAGCANSTSRGGALLSSGHSRLDADDLVLYVGGLPRTLALVLQGATRPSGSTSGFTGLPFGDGLFCLQTPMLRLGAVQTSMVGFTFPAPDGTRISKLGNLQRPTTAYYQVWYRDPLPVCKGAGDNWTNGLMVVWTF
jgi:hypothetical protein